MNDAKNCERVDAPMEERKMEEKMQGMGRGSTCINVGNVERELVKFLRKYS